MDREQIQSTGAGRGNFKSYAIGFVVSIVLTTIAFWLVIKSAVPHSIVLSGIIVTAVAQILVHLHYFLHLNTSSTVRWNILVLLFTLLIMILFVGGTIWIMFNLKYRMM
jgi:cytochrome o ubiquinol oxidase subunit IV